MLSNLIVNHGLKRHHLSEMEASRLFQVQFSATQIGGRGSDPETYTVSVRAMDAGEAVTQARQIASRMSLENFKSLGTTVRSSSPEMGMDSVRVSHNAQSDLVGVGDRHLPAEEPAMSPEPETSAIEETRETRGTGGIRESAPPVPTTPDRTDVAVKNAGEFQF